MQPEFFIATEERVQLFIELNNLPLTLVQRRPNKKRNNFSRIKKPFRRADADYFSQEIQYLSEFDGKREKEKNELDQQGSSEHFKKRSLNGRNMQMIFPSKHKITSGNRT